MVYKACFDRSGCRGEGGMYGLPFLSQAFSSETISSFLSLTKQ